MRTSSRYASAGCGEKRGRGRRRGGVPGRRRLRGGGVGGGMVAGAKASCGWYTGRVRRGSSSGWPVVHRPRGGRGQPQCLCHHHCRLLLLVVLLLLLLVVLLLLLLVVLLLLLLVVLLLLLLLVVLLVVLERCSVLHLPAPLLPLSSAPPFSLPPPPPSWQLSRAPPLSSSPGDTLRVFPAPSWVLRGKRPPHPTPAAPILLGESYPVCHWSATGVQGHPPSPCRTPSPSPGPWYTPWGSGSSAQAQILAPGCAPGPSLRSFTPSLKELWQMSESDIDMEMDMDTAPSPSSRGAWGRTPEAAERLPASSGCTAAE